MGTWPMNLTGMVDARRHAALSVRSVVIRTIRRSRKRPNRAQLLVSAVVLVMLMSATWLFVRNSSLVAVRQVRVVGLAGYYDRVARKAVADEALTMTTMNADSARIAAAAGEFVDVAGVRIERDFPHGLTIFVDVRRPVAAARIGARVYAVTGSGLVLDDAKNLTALPNVTFAGVVSKGHVTDPKAREALMVLGAAPDVMLRQVKTLKWGRGGLTLVFEKDVQLIFGNAKNATAKWRAAAAVLASDAAKGAKYIDLRVPGRPAIGGLGAAPVT
ncbi:MAG: cell division protein FtsQ/DivIB, partial [Thermoleophilia bacterium]|nr:cell division protein FtsQ/DivIB [Thermoleophilia bacterium]